MMVTFGSSESRGLRPLSDRKLQNSAARPLLSPPPCVFLVYFLSQGAVQVDVYQLNNWWSVVLRGQGPPFLPQGFLSTCTFSVVFCLVFMDVVHVRLRKDTRSCVGWCLWLLGLPSPPLPRLGEQAGCCPPGVDDGRSFANAWGWWRWTHRKLGMCEVHFSRLKMTTDGSGVCM